MAMATPIARTEIAQNPGLEMSNSLLILSRLSGIRRTGSSQMKIWPGCLYWLVLFAGLAMSLSISADSDILVLQSHDSPPYRQMLEGFQNSLVRIGLSASYGTVLLIDTDPQKVRQVLESQPPKLIFTLGTPAAKAALDNPQRIPVVAGLLLDAGNLLQEHNATGISLDFPAAVQWLWLRRLLPDIRRIAVLYDPRHGGQLFEALQREAQAENIQLIPSPALQQEGLPGLLANLPSQLDAIWALDGVAAFSATSVRELLLYSFRNRTPLIGLSEQWVRAGAIYALDWDYADLGSQAAEMALAVLNKGKTLKELPVQAPRKVRPVFNSKTAEHMKLTFPEQWLREMTEVAP